MFRFNFDANYLRLLTDGDAETEQHFLTYFGRLLVIKLRQRRRSQQEILDARQETLMRVLVAVRQKRAVEHPERLGAFVNSVCNNVLLEMGRAARRTVPLDESTGDGPQHIAPDNPEMSLVSAERQAHVRAALDQLPERDRRLLRQVFLDEHDKDTVCKDFGVDRQYLRVLLHRAKARFREVYEREHSRAM